mmetsp:Transcript_15898/g.43984  ORF Transcript_15898/g.43984 Transcript_15898/m.43984 type:complete len:156 (+) Transcript_15898:32-499(+)|eukprot:CAMPEP_0172362182 /NCGR_PEP_ID=MMETSP1060-20121228/5856_1 /TAXON_ID=37318 /ORGANISM="Pseudo-nitzschia pungens, Strain cf. cingulata" /LENGTH=155 /DNA_ID=CAMNT_0013084631 /DNA_START=21 /DNA_END=488 /DNA_ORIENTATION=+
MKFLSSIRFLPLLGLLCLVGLSKTAQAFVQAPALASPGSKTQIASPFVTGSFGVDSSTQLQERRKELSNADRGSENVNNLMGLGRGKYLWAIAIAINIWFFSVPVEFRRTRICNEADSAAYPEKCMTGKQFREGIQSYYANGGGIKFDFSIEGKE